MANVFKEGKMLSNVADSYLTNAVADFDMPDGSFITLGDLAADTTYAADGLEYDTYKAGKVNDPAKDEVVVVDYAGIAEGAIAGNVYKLGNKLHDLVVPAGEITRVRRLALHDKFWIAEGNFNGAVASNKYAILEKSKLTLKPAAAIAEPATGLAVKILLKEDLTAGMRSAGTLYLCEVVRL